MPSLCEDYSCREQLGSSSLKARPHWFPKEVLPLQLHPKPCPCCSLSRWGEGGLKGPFLGFD